MSTTQKTAWYLAHRIREIIPAKLHQFSGLGFLRRGRRGRARSLKLEPSTALV